MKGDLSLFKRAMIEATCEIYDEQCSSLPLPPVSRRHKRRLAAIGVPVSGASTSMRFVAILVAVLFFLAGCGVFRDEICGMLLSRFEGFVRVDYQVEHNAPKKLETLYLPSVLFEEYTEFLQTRVLYDSYYHSEWISADRCQIIKYSQETQYLGGMLIDTVTTKRYPLQHGDLKILKFENADYHFYVWKDKGYVFSLYTKLLMSDAEIFAIIDSLAPYEADEICK